MENKKTKVSVLVAGQRFNIITDKSEKYVIDIASEIDARINSLCISGEMTRERAAVLTALDYADDSQLDKENIAAVKEQIKDYLAEIDRLKDVNSKLTDDYNLLKAEYERLIEDNLTVADMEKAAEAYKSRISELEAQVKSLKNDIEDLKNQPGDIQTDGISDREAPPEKEPVITADDDLFFDTDEEEPVKPVPQKKKNRHEHNHVNPYKQNAEKKKEQKGYTQQRQYSFFDINEE